MLALSLPATLTAFSGFDSAPSPVTQIQSAALDDDDDDGEEESEPEGLGGVYYVNNPDGTPPLPGSEITTWIVHVPWPLNYYAGFVFVDGEEVKGERFHAYDNGDGTYDWENFKPDDKKATGKLTPRDGGGFVSTVETGPFAGTVRHLTR